MYLRAGNTACPLSQVLRTFMSIPPTSFKLVEIDQFIERLQEGREYVFKADRKIDRREVYPYTCADGRVCGSVSAWNYFKQ